jgi:hypothetical protein
MNGATIFTLAPSGRARVAEAGVQRARSTTEPFVPVAFPERRGYHRSPEIGQSVAH